MKFEALQKGKLIRRYKSFLTDIALEDGTVILAHCANSGSMKSCLEEGADVYCSPVKDPKRKTRFTWAMAAGVEVLVVQAKVTPEEITFARMLPVR